MYQKWCPLSNPILLIRDKAANYHTDSCTRCVYQKKKEKWIDPRAWNFFGLWVLKMRQQVVLVLIAAGCFVGVLFYLPLIFNESQASNQILRPLPVRAELERNQEWRHFNQQFHNILNRKNTLWLHQIVFGTGQMDWFAIELWRYHRIHESSRGQRKSIRNSSARRAFWREPKIVVFTSIPCLC